MEFLLKLSHSYSAGKRASWSPLILLLSCILFRVGLADIYSQTNTKGRKVKTCILVQSCNTGIAAVQTDSDGPEVYWKLEFSAPHPQHDTLYQCTVQLLAST